MKALDLDPYRAWKTPNFRLYFAGHALGILGLQMQFVAVGWELYERTASAMVLGLVGLFQIIPVILLTLVVGQVADRFSRQRIVTIAHALTALCSLALVWLSYTQGPVWGYYLSLFLGGVAYAFYAPANSALLPQLVPKDVFPNAVTWNSTGFQVASISGPALGGLLIALAHSATPVYLFRVLFELVGVFCLLGIRANVSQSDEIRREPPTWQTMLEGFRFVRREKILLSSMTLDLFAVILGGATTLLPIYAKDILHVGPTGLGWLRAAPSIGALITAVMLTHRPPLSRAGHDLLWAVVGFGVCTIIFGLSTSFWLSWVMLGLAGALDNISAVIRATLVQIRTPDEMRGRVSAINYVFIGMSNELGGFESGLVAAYFGPIVSVVSGGIGTLIVVLIVAAVWPQLRQLRSLTEPEPEPLVGKSTL